MYAAGRGGYRPGPSRGGFVGMGRGFENGADDGRAQTCYKCGGPNHYARDCHAKTVKCYACGKFEGHIVYLTPPANLTLQSRECPYNQPGPTTDPAAGVGIPQQPTLEP